MKRTIYPGALIGLWILMLVMQYRMFSAIGRGSMAAAESFLGNRMPHVSTLDSVLWAFFLAAVLFWAALAQRDPDSRQRIFPTLVEGWRMYAVLALACAYAMGASVLMEELSHDTAGKILFLLDGMALGLLLLRTYDWFVPLEPGDLEEIAALANRPEKENPDETRTAVIADA